MDVTDVEIETGLNQALVGWSTTEDGTDNVGESVQIKGNDIDLYPIIKDVVWITYHSEGGSYLEPTQVVPGSVPTKPADPTRIGYSFTGWKTEDGQDYGFNSPLSTSIDLYASWQGQRVSYRVAYWLENADDDGYTYEESETREGIAGQFTSEYAAGWKEYEGFQRGTIPQIRIAGDGSTVVNVYYDRNEYTITFYSQGRRGWSEIEKLTITAKYGADISDQWPSIRFPGEYSANWYVSEPSYWNQPNMQAHIDIMPLYGQNFYETDNEGNYTYYINHYLEALPGDTGNTISGYGNRQYYSEPRVEIII